MPGWDLCRACYEDLPRNVNCCSRCAQPMLVSCVAPDYYCGQCLKTPPAFDTVHAPFLYTGAIGYLVSGLKFNRRLAYARVLGQLLAESLRARRDHWPECIIPVPLHRKRRTARGFNQTLEIARVMAEWIEVPVAAALCRRIIDTPHQVGLPADVRRVNLRGAFRATPGATQYRHVAVLDDVMTTGSTIEEIARCLKQAGVTTVDVWVCGRA